MKHTPTATLILSTVLLLAAQTNCPAQATLTKVTTGNIVNDLGYFTRAAWGDFDNDGFLDLFVANYYNGTNVYYHNNGNGTFTKIANRDPVNDSDYHIGAVVGDYDNDGFLDLVVSAGGGAPTARRAVLYHNNGDGTFSHVGSGALTNQVGFFGACAWADYDNDGFLDLFIANDGDSLNGGQNLLFHNNGDGTFTKTTSGAIVNGIGVGIGAVWADYDNDGFMDLLVVNLGGNGPVQNFLYHNDRNGKFTRVLTNAVATDSWSSGAQCGAWGDYDNDGLQDLFVTDNAGARNHLYHNNGNGTFTNVISDPALAAPRGGYSAGCAWGDYDNDGYLDLFVCSVDAHNQLFHNNGNGTFTQILSGDPVSDGGPGITCNSCSWVDYDNDGFLDLFVARGGGAAAPLPNLLYHNNGNSNAWLEVKCVGTVANRSAIGTKVRVYATIGGKTFWQLREISSGGGGNCVPLVTHFGLGDATNANTVRIEWPSGTVQEFHNVAAKQILTIVEPSRLRLSATNKVVQLTLRGQCLVGVHDGSTQLVNSALGRLPLRLGKCVKNWQTFSVKALAR